MESQHKEDSGSQVLQKLAEQLQYYRVPGLIEELENMNGHNMSSTFEIIDPVADENEQFTCATRGKRRAAVLIALFEGYHGELRVILTKRSMKLSSHPGDVALPGGKMEEGDVDHSAIALREAMEEIGLDSHLIQVVVKLEPFSSQNQLRVFPVVGLLSKIQDFKPVLNYDEVDAIFDVPLEMFLKIQGGNSNFIVLQEDNHRCEEREWNNHKYIFHCFDIEMEQGSFLIYGLTASILIRAATVIYHRIPSFGADLPDFQQLQRALSKTSSNQ